MSELPKLSPQSGQEPDPPKPLIHGGCAVVLGIFVAIKLLSMLMDYLGVDF